MNINCPYCGMFLWVEQPSHQAMGSLSSEQMMAIIVLMAHVVQYHPDRLLGRYGESFATERKS